MDTRLARTVVALQSATAFIKEDKKSGSQFMEQNKTYFPNDKVQEEQKSKKKGRKKKEKEAEAEAEKEKEKERPKIIKIPTFVELNHEQKIKQKNKQQKNNKV